MKTLFTLLLPLIASIPTSAQFTLSGKVLNYKGEAPLSVNIPEIYGFHNANTISVPVSGTGEFSIILPVDSVKFASLIFQRRFHTLLLTKGKNLKVQLDEQNKQLALMAGSAVPENALLQESGIGETPSFMLDQKNYEGLSFAELNKQLIAPWQAEQDKKIRLVNASRISPQYKNLMAAEIKYVTYNHLNDFARTAIRNRAAMDSFILRVFDSSSIHPQVFPAGPQYYTFTDNYIRYLETKAFIKIKQENIKPHEPIPYFQISLDSANALVKKYGKPYWRWVGSTKNFPPAITEQYTYQQIVNLYQDKDLTQTSALAEAFRKHFPQSTYNAGIRQKVLALQAMLATNESNADIAIVKDYDKVQSIYEVIKAQKGKVVYLDVWGTWCGPCKEELKHVPRLKAAFRDKDVVFVYLDMDDDNRDALWREFIKVNGLTGLHLRKNRQTIAPFWQELLAGAQDQSQNYPQYFIFDRSGKLAVSRALRPGDGEALYRQINAVLLQ